MKQCLVWRKTYTDYNKVLCLQYGALMFTKTHLYMWFMEVLHRL